MQGEKPHKQSLNKWAKTSPTCNSIAPKKGTNNQKEKDQPQNRKRLWTDNRIEIEIAL